VALSPKTARTLNTENMQKNELCSSRTELNRISTSTLCPEKNEATSILGITLTNLNTVS